MILKAKIWMILGVLLLTVTTSYAEIIKTDDFATIQKVLNNTSKNTLVIFDVDDVILQPSDQILQSPYKSYLLELDADLSTRNSPAEILYLRSITMIAQQPQLIDSRLIDTLAELQAKQIPTIALTYCGTGQQGKIANIEDWRIEKLLALGVDFSKLNSLKDYRFSTIPASYGAPLIKSGIVFTALADKGIVLNAVLKHEHLQPKKIIFIDDKLNNLQSVQTVALRNNIAFLGIEYTAVKNAPKIAPLNKKRAKLQFEMLEKDQVWLSDSQADQVLQQRGP